jgi:tRNA pseudouridine32 synthase/23S rRNA pseudouridine746 synthase
VSSLKIIFDHKNFIVVDKPSGVLTVPSRHEKDDERAVLGRMIEQKLKTQVFPVHRLDFEVSGIVIFAKDARSQSELNAVFEKRTAKKVYEALTTKRDFSHWPPNLKKADESLDLKPGNEFTWECKIMRGKKRSFESPHGDKSLTKARFISDNGDYLKWEIEPLTGRSHQIRFELSRHGFPILGDSLYGSKISYGENTIALRAVKLTVGNLWPDMPAEFQVEGLNA